MRIKAAVQYVNCHVNLLPTDVCHVLIIGTFGKCHVQSNEYPT